MKLFSLLALMPAVLIAKPVYYSDQVRHVDLRSTSPSLLMFESPVISVACQPAWVEFESLTPKTLAIEEQNQVRARSLAEKKEDEERLLKQMIRIKPLRKKGTSRCAFVLGNADEVTAEFSLKESITTPLVEFKPFSSLEEGLGKSPELRVLSSLLKGEPMGLLEKRSDHQTCRSSRDHGKNCHNYKFETELAKYEITYLGKSTMMSAWIVKAKLKKKATFKQVADLEANRGLISFSLTKPQRDVYEAGTELKHHIIGRGSLTKEDLKGVMR